MYNIYIYKVLYITCICKGVRYKTVGVMRKKSSKCGEGERVIYKKEVTLKKGQPFIQIINMIYENATP